jgi:hypothetical protein
LPTTRTRLALGGEDLRIGQQQILAFHARAARARTDQQRHMAVAECDPGVIAGNDFIQRRERAIAQFHDHPVQGRQRRGDFQQVQIDALVGAQHVAGGNSKGQGIADLAGGARNRDIQRWLHEGSR